MKKTMKTFLAGAVLALGSLAAMAADPIKVGFPAVDTATGMTACSAILAALLRREKVFAYRYEGRRYDCGSKEGFLEANVELALKHPELRDSFRQYLKELEF